MCPTCKTTPCRSARATRSSASSRLGANGFSTSRAMPRLRKSAGDGMVVNGRGGHETASASPNKWPMVRENPGAAFLTTAKTWLALGSATPTAPRPARLLRMRACSLPRCPTPTTPTAQARHSAALKMTYRSTPQPATFTRSIYPEWLSHPSPASPRCTLGMADRRHTLRKDATCRAPHAEGVTHPSPGSPAHWAGAIPKRSLRRRRYTTKPRVVVAHPGKSAIPTRSLRRRRYTTQPRACATPSGYKPVYRPPTSAHCPTLGCVVQPFRGKSLSFTAGSRR